MLARLFRDLEPFHPTLVGSYPLGLQVDGSTLDIACACDDLDTFEHRLRATLTALGVAGARIERRALPAVVAAFNLGELDIAISGQATPIHAQTEFRHLVLEGQLLLHGGAELRARVRERKRGGARTEPAFADVLGLAGDPHAAMLELERWPPGRLRALVTTALREQAAPVIAIHTGDRAPLLPLFRIADDSDSEIASYLARGTVITARADGALVGHVQMIEDAPATWELKSLAVVEAYRQTGLGRRLVEAGLAHARSHGASRVLLATGAADTQLLRFYQRAGFRMLRIERDAFTPAQGYPAELFVDGIRLLDRAWLDVTW